MRLLFHDPNAYALHVARADASPKLEKLAAALVDLDGALRELKEQPVKTETLIFTEVCPGYPLWSLLYDEDSPLSRDTKLGLQLAVDMAASVSEAAIEAFEIIGRLGLVPVCQEVYLATVNDWRMLVRKELRCTEWTGAEFVDLCKRAFPDLVFSEEFPNCLGGFEGGMLAHRDAIVGSLSSLHDKLRSELGTQAIKTGLRAFSAASGFETTMEGDASRHDDLTFKFTDEKKVAHSKLCEPHMKLSSSGVAGDSHFYFHRLYFSPAEHVEFPQKILVGHLGAHA